MDPNPFTHGVAYCECCLDIETHLDTEIFEWPPVLADLLELICCD